MIRMSAIWDRTMEVIRGRGAMLATIVVLLSFLPTVAQNALKVFTPAGSPGVALLVGLLSLAVGVLAVWNNLALVAAGGDPAVTSAGEAITIGGRRIGPALGIGLLLVLAVFVLMIPAGVILLSSMVDLAALRANPGNPLAAFTPPSAGAMGGLGLYLLAFVVFAMWLGARLFVLWAVILNERRGLGAIGRSFELTRGLTWRLVGVELLFGLVLLIASFAVGAVVGVIGGLAFGRDHAGLATFIAQVATSAMAAAFSVVVTVFAVQLYRAITGTEAARTFA